MADNPATFEKADSNPKIALLTKLLAHPYVELYRYAEDGPPEGTESVSSRLSRYPFYIGWAAKHPTDDGHIAVTSSLDGSSWAEGGVRSVGLHDNARGDTSDTTYSDLGDDQAAERRYNDVLAVEIAKSLNADIYITDRPYLFNTRLPIKKNILVVSPEDALPVISLYLRTQGENLINDSDGVRFMASDWTFFWIATHDLLSQSWRLFSACSQHSQGSSDNKVSMLEGTLQHRLCHALQARDRLHVAVNNLNRGESLISELDSVLINILAAFDVLAKIAHKSIGLTTDIKATGWQKEAWLQQLADAGHGALADLVNNGSDGKKLLDLLLPLRNTMHEESMLAVRSFDNSVGRNIETSVVLPSGKARAIVDASNNLGGIQAWGIKHTASMYFVEPDTLIDKLVPAAFELLDRIIEKMPLENLSHVNLRPEDCQPPNDDIDTFSQANRDSVRWQLGV